MLYAEMGERMTEKTEDELKRELKSISEIFGNLDFTEIYNEEEKLAEIVKDETEKYVRNYEGLKEYYISLDHKIYPKDEYDKEVTEGTRSPSDIYAYVSPYTTIGDFDEFLLGIYYLHDLSVADFVRAYIRKKGFTIVNEHEEPPTPNLKYYINVVANYAPGEYWLGINIYDADALAESLKIPKIIKQRLGNKLKITSDDVKDIVDIVIWKQPIIAGQTYHDAWLILYQYYINKDEARKIYRAYADLLPTPYQLCYTWKCDERPVKTDCPKLDLF